MMETTNLNWLAGFLNHEEYHDVLTSQIHHGHHVLMFRSHSQAIFSPNTWASFRSGSTPQGHIYIYIPGNLCVYIYKYTYMWYIRVGISCQQRVMMLLPTTRYQNQKLTICVTVAVSKKKKVESKRVSAYRRKILSHLKKSTRGNQSLYHDCYVWSELSSTKHIQRTLKPNTSKYCPHITTKCRTIKLKVSQ